MRNLCSLFVHFFFLKNCILVRTYQVGRGARFFRNWGDLSCHSLISQGKGRLAVRAATSGAGALTVSIISDASVKGGLRTEKEFSLLLVVYFLMHVGQLGNPLSH